MMYNESRNMSLHLHAPLIMLDIATITATLDNMNISSFMRNKYYIQSILARL